MERVAGLMEEMDLEQDGHAKTRVLAARLVGLAAQLKKLEGQAHLIHLNYRGANFLPVHEWLKGQYEMHLEQFDAVCEYVRSMNYLLPLSEQDLRTQKEDFEEVGSYDCCEMLCTYCRNLEAMGEMAKDLEPEAQRVREIDVANYLAELVAAAYKSAWFVKATVS